MNIKIKGKEQEIKYTFHSFNFMADLDFDVLQEVEHKPFLIAPFCHMMVLGGVNNNPKKKVISALDVSEALETYLEEDGDIMELFEGLLAELEKSNFFKSLQKKTEEK